MAAHHASQEVVLYLATSLDGHIAREDGGVDWLEPFEDADYGEYGYQRFYDSVGSLVMGRATYQQALSFGPWPYSGKPAVVLSRDYVLFPPPQPEVLFRTSHPHEVCAELKAAAPGHVWLVGGGKTARDYLSAGVVDRIILHVMPVVLGAGVPLFPHGTPELQLDLQDSQRFPNGAVVLNYRVLPTEPLPEPA